MDANRFNREVRPFVTEVRSGVQGVAFDRVELDAWWKITRHSTVIGGNGSNQQRLAMMMEARDMLV